MSVFSAGGQVLDFRVFIQELLHARFFDFAFVFSIYFIADENEREVLWFLGRTLVEELSYPRLNVVEGLFSTQVTRLFVMS